MQHPSEVVRLVQQIQAEYEAGERVPKKIPQDVQDYFITKRIENMGKCQQELIALVGATKASELLAEVGL